MGMRVPVHTAMQVELRSTGTRRRPESQTTQGGSCRSLWWQQVCAVHLKRVAAWCVSMSQARNALMARGRHRYI